MDDATLADTVRANVIAALGELEYVYSGGEAAGLDAALPFTRNGVPYLVVVRYSTVAAPPPPTRAEAMAAQAAVGGEHTVRFVHVRVGSDGTLLSSPQPVGG